MKKGIGGFLGAVFFIAIMAWAMRPFYIGPLKAIMWDGKATLVCESNQKMSLSGKTADIAEGPAIEMKDNCRLSCKNCNLKGEVGVLVKGNGQLTLVGGSIAGTESGIGLEGNGSVEAESGAITGPVGIDASSAANSKIKLKEMSITATKIGMDIASNAQVDARDTTIKSVVGIKAGGNSQVSFKKGAVEAETIAVDQSGNAKLIFKEDPKVTGKINARKGSVEGLK